MKQSFCFITRHKINPPSPAEPDEFAQYIFSPPAQEALEAELWRADRPAKADVAVLKNIPMTRIVTARELECPNR
jgi:hypothetical protein